jgi:hypothetical protein
MGRHYNRAKKQGGSGWRKGHDCQNDNRVTEGPTCDRLATDYGVSPVTITRNAAFAAAVETLRTIDYHPAPDEWRPTLPGGFAQIPAKPCPVLLRPENNRPATGRAWRP